MTPAKCTLRVYGARLYAAVLGQDEKNKLRTAIKTNAERGEDLIWLKKEHGTLEYPHKNLVVLLTKD